MLEIHNFYERLVTEQLVRMAEHSEELSYKEFMEDVACLALNHLPSRYIRSLVDLHSHASYQDTENMHQQVAEAINTALVQARRRAEPLRE